MDKLELQERLILISNYLMSPVSEEYYKDLVNKHGVAFFDEMVEKQRAKEYVKRMKQHNLFKAISLTANKEFLLKELHKVAELLDQVHGVKIELKFTA